MDFHIRRFAFFILFLLALSCSAQKEKALLYQVEKDGIQPFYLFGTVHMLPQEDFYLSENVKDALGESEALVFELDITDRAMQMKIMQLSVMSKGDSIQAYLSKDQCAVLNGMLIESSGVPLAMVQNMKPFMISTFLIGRFIEGQPASFEFSLLEVAQADSIPVLGLETVEEQMAIFDSIPYAEQAAALLEMIEKDDEQKALFREIIEAYKESDVEALYQLLNENMDSKDEKYFLLEKRNKTWIKRLEDIASRQTTFFAVGAGHIGGDTGLLNLLTQNGYSVESLPDRSK